MCAAVMDGTIVTLLRREDMLVLDLSFVNVRRVRDLTGATVLIPADAAAAAFVKVTLPPQAMLEEALAAGAAAPLRARFSGPSVLAFELPRERSVPFTTAGLLAEVGLRGSPARSDVECVWDLTLRPAASDAMWAHAAAPVTSAAGVTELWHTRLTAGDGAGARPSVPLAGARTSGFDVPFGSLKGDQRRAIARAIGTRPVLARELTLSALGATIDLVGDWTDQPHLGVARYRHNAVLGRDQSVGVTERGYLLPFGFPVERTTNTERRLGRAGAALVQTSQLTVLAPEVRYDGAVGVPSFSRDFPFRRVRLGSPLSAEIGVLDEVLAAGVSWVNTPSGARLAFNLTAEDFEGQTISFSAPVAFVPLPRAFEGLAPAVDRYQRDRAGTPVPAAGRVALVPTPGGGETAVDVTALYIGARVADADAAALRAAGQLAAFPRLAGVDARIPALEAFGSGPGTTGVPAAVAGGAVTRAAGLAARAPARLRLDETYVRSGLAAAGGIYAKLEPQVAFAAPETHVGGIAALSLPVSGLSLAKGLVGGDLEAFRSGQFDPAKYFKPGPELPALLPPRLLGFLRLADLVERTTVGDGEAAPRIVTEVVHRAGDHNQPPEAVRSTVTWRPKVKAGFHGGTLRTTTATTLDLRSETLVRLGGPPPSSDVRGELRSFAMEFAGGLLVVRFDRLAFTARSGATPSLDVKVADVGFGDQLGFLDWLRPYLPSPPNGPRVAVTAREIVARHTLAIPKLSLGAFLLQNLALSASVTLPLDGRPVQSRFAVSSRDHPFLVTVSLFGGGGFVAVEAGRGLTVEGQIEFGAATSLDLGVASASVAVTAGVYVRAGDQGATVKGFFRAVGELDVAGLVNVSVELYLGLEYRKNPTHPQRSELHGWASLTVRVRVLFFSESVTVTVERSFGVGDDPTFDVAFPTPDPWRRRCAAFAPMVRP
jgi:hypothetical protein